MKTFLKFTALLAVLLMLAGLMFSCSNGEETLCCTNYPCLDDGGLGGEVAYKPCDCENPLASFQFQRGEAYLFRDYIPEQMNSYMWGKANSHPFPHVVSIVYNSETKEAEIRIKNLTTAGESADLLTLGPICNFPEFAKEWDIPESGIRVIFEGRMYEPCNPYGFTHVIRIDYVLTKLERR